MDNVMVNSENQVFLIDYGCCQKIKMPDGSDRPNIIDQKFGGNINFASKNCLNGETLSKRDDLI